MTGSSLLSNATILSTQDRLPSGKACLGCRKRKNRCSGERPVCNFCQKRNLDCHYAAVTRRSVANQSYVWSLQEKIRRLERETKETPHGRSNVPDSPSVTSHSDAENLEHFDDPTDQTSLDKFATAHNDASNEQVLVDDASPDVLTYNETSVHTIVRDVVLGSNAISSVNDSVESCKAFSSPQKRARRETVIRRSNELDSDNFILPPFVLAKDLLDNFFTYVHPLWPILHEPGFRKEFAAAYRDSTQLTTAWRAILNLVFAFGCDYVDMTLKEAFEMAQTFHDRGADLILSVCFEQSTVQIVQALFLLTAHLQSDLKMNKCWLSIGCLVRTAQGLRMNQDPSNWDISLVDQEIRKRLWWGIYCLDRFVSLKQGQSPTLLSENMPPVGVPLTSQTSMTEDDDSMLPELVQAPSPIHLFNAMVQLSHMAEAIPVSTFAAAQELAENYISRPDGQLELDEVQLSLQLAQIGEQEAKLAAWRRNLPDHLQREMSGADQESRRQYLILYLRYLHIRLLIHRHMFSMVVRQGNRKVIMPSPGYLKSMITASVIQCAECATETVSIITTNEDARAIGPWWCNIQLMFTALGTLLAIHASGNLFPEIDTVAIAASINDASNSMRQLSSVSGLMASCYKYFESLRRRMVKVGRENKPQEDRIAARPSMYVADDSNHETDQLPQDPQTNGAANDISTSPETDGVGSLDEDWTRLFLEPLLPDFTSDVFNT